MSGRSPSRRPLSVEHLQLRWWREETAAHSSRVGRAQRHCPLCLDENNDCVAEGERQRVRDGGGRGLRWCCGGPGVMSVCPDNGVSVILRTASSTHSCFQLCGANAALKLHLWIVLGVFLLRLD